MDALAGSCLTIVLDARGNEICRLLRSTCGQPVLHGAELQRVLLDYGFPTRLREAREFQRDGSADDMEIAAVARHIIAHFRDGHLVSDNCRVAFIYIVYPADTFPIGTALWLKIQAGRLDGTTPTDQLECTFEDSPIESFVAQVEQDRYGKHLQFLAEFDELREKMRLVELQSASPILPSPPASSFPAKSNPAEQNAVNETAREWGKHTKPTIDHSTEIKTGEMTSPDVWPTSSEYQDPLMSVEISEKRAAAFQQYNHIMRTDPAFRAKQEFDQKWRERFDDFHYGWWMFGIFFISGLITDAYRTPIWPMGIFTFLLMLTVLEASYWVYVRRIATRFGALILAIAVLSSGHYSLKIYNQIESHFRDSAGWIAPPTVDEDSVSEVGYIYDVESEIDFRLQSKQITWWAKVPDTAKVYSCFWTGGYSRFSKDDAVEVIHKKSRAEANASFIVGLNGKQTASCW